MKLKIKNFRSIREQSIELSPITIVYGYNGSGKSSLLYSLLTLKNIVLNSNQSTAGFFNYTFANLGSFEAVVFDHQKHDGIELGITLESMGICIDYTIFIMENEGYFLLYAQNGFEKIALELGVTFPYPANQQDQQTISANQSSFDITWNGLTANVQPREPDQTSLEEAERLRVSLNAAPELIRSVDFIPLRRGFSKPQYSSVSVSPLMVTEDEVATHLANDKYLVGRVGHYIEKILDRDFRVSMVPGTAIFSLDTTDRKTGVTSELVNDGFGISQMIYLLAKALRSDVRWICIEEPEIHLHPTAIRHFAQALVKMAQSEKKSFVISTHSEPLVLALITLVAKGELRPDDLSCYLALKENKITKFERQLVNEKGQITGGLTSFLEGELEDTKTFLLNGGE